MNKKSCHTIDRLYWQAEIGTIINNMMMTTHRI